MQSILADNYPSPEDELIAFETVWEIVLEYLHLMLDFLEIAVILL